MMIKILPPEIANRIAAGEVVERPASVIRELIDNAIDAGATRIDIEIENGGLNSMRVTDNGCGMSREDAQMCIKRHATSKIHTVEDLDAITTRGFRGEALAAISSVSKLEIVTRPPDEEFAAKIVVEGGKEFPPTETGAPAGTTIKITDLFYNTPARRKFLKKPATEMGHVLSTINWFALAHEAVHFTFAHNGRRSLDMPPVDNLPERIKQVFSKEMLDDMIPVSLDTPVVSISGLISRPTLTRNGSQHIYFFINNRYIKDRLLHRAVMNGYRNLLPTGRFPVVFLFLEVNPHDIDINVHPTKQEIKFYREDAIFSAMYGAIRQAWDTREEAKAETAQIFESLQHEKSKPVVSGPNVVSVPKQDGYETAKQVLDHPKEQKEEEKNPPHQLSSFDDSKEETSAKVEDISIPPPPPPTEEFSKKNTQQVIESISQLNRKELGQPSQHPVSEQEKVKSIEESGLADLGKAEKRPEELFSPRSLEGAGELTVRGQLLNSYILAEGTDGLYVIDQHAAHERILFEEFLLESERAAIASQPLLFPLTVDFSPDDAVILEENEPLFQQLGYDMEPFGPKTFVIRSVPSALTLEDAESFIKDVIGELKHEGNSAEKRERALHTMACRAAVKFGDSLSFEDMSSIIRGLEKIPRRNVCPHGRPNILFLSDDVLRRLFKRTGFS